MGGSVVESRMEHEQMTGDVEEEHRLQVSPEELKVIRETLLDRSLTMAQRYRSVFTLRNIGGDEAISILAESFNDPSALLKHEVAYCLGQMQNVTALPHLERLLRNAEENSMVRHEAGEALGAIGLEESLPLLEQYSRDSVPEVAETCSLAIDTIKYKLKHKGSKAPFESAHMSIDPAPPSAKRSVEELQQRLAAPRDRLRAGTDGPRGRCSRAHQGPAEPGRASDGTTRSCGSPRCDRHARGHGSAGPVPDRQGARRQGELRRRVGHERVRELG